MGMLEVCQNSTIHHIWKHSVLEECSFYQYSTYHSAWHLFPVILKLTLTKNSQVEITLQLSKKMHDLLITNTLKSEKFCIQYKVMFTYLLIVHLLYLVNGI